MDMPLNGDVQRHRDSHVLQDALGCRHREIDVVEHQVANRYRADAELADCDGLQRGLVGA
jgi:hypothetical protein